MSICLLLLYLLQTINPFCYKPNHPIQIKITSVTYTKNVPLVLILCIKSYLFMSVSAVPVKDIADALFTRISIPPNLATAASTADLTCFSSRTSTMQARLFPPAFSTKNDQSQNMQRCCYETAYLPHKQCILCQAILGGAQLF